MYREAPTTVTLGAGEERVVTMRSDSEPERIVVDPDVRVLQLRRVAARLGDALAYALRVERILLQRNESYPCFTLLEPRFDDRDSGWRWMDDET